jgi:hypothetical protein
VSTTSLMSEVPFAFAVWEHGTLVRSLSLSPADGIIEDTGTPAGLRTPLLGW